MHYFGMLIWNVAKFTNSEFGFIHSKLHKLIHVLLTNYNEKIYIKYSRIKKYVQMAQMIPLFLAEEEENTSSMTR